MGRTGIKVSEVGFGCGNVGGLMIRGSPSERVRAIARAFELGINYFDTAPSYGNGQSETNLGKALRGPNKQGYVGTKVLISASEMNDIKTAIPRSLKSSLMRLERDYVDVFYLHNPIAQNRNPSSATLSVQDVLGDVAESFGKLKKEGRVRFTGLTGLGQTEALHRVIDSGQFDAVQVVFNLLNPSAGYIVPQNFYAQDFRRLIDAATDKRMGVVVIRVLAAGVLSQAEERHPIAAPFVEPIGSGSTYKEDGLRSKAFDLFVRKGHLENLPEAAIRFAISKKEVSTVLVGYSDIKQMEESVSNALKGPLAPEALGQLEMVWKQFGGA